MIRNPYHLSLLTVTIATTTIFLGACDQTRDLLGLKRSHIDEFAVMDRQPLSTPPNYRLQPPTTDPSPSSTANTARSALTGKTTSPYAYAGKSTPSTAEKALLAKAGATNADASIRSTLAKEACRGQTADDDIVFWTQQQTSPSEKEVINPIAEHKTHSR